MRQTPYDSYLRTPSKGEFFDGMMRDSELETVIFATYRMVEMYYYDIIDMWRYGEIYLNQDPAE